MRIAIGALGLGAPPADNVGTYSDPNCPTWCFFAGNVLDEALSNQCWPCHNICPNGTSWDKTSASCLPAGGGPAATSSCPGYCAWVPFANTLFTECQPCTQTSGGSGLTTPGLIGVAVGGIALILLLVAVVKR